MTKPRGDIKTPTMTREHFEYIADIIANELQGSMYSRRYVAQVFAENLTATNHNFDFAKFIAACDAPDVD